MDKLTYNLELRSFSEERDKLQAEIRKAEKRVNRLLKTRGDEPAFIRSHAPNKPKKGKKNPGFKGTKADQERYINIAMNRCKPIIKRNTIAGSTVGTGLGAGIGALATKNTMNRLATRHPDWSNDKLKKRTKLIRSTAIASGGIIGGVAGGVVTNRATRVDIRKTAGARFKLMK